MKPQGKGSTAPRNCRYATLPYGDAGGSRTRDSTMKGQRLNHLTTAPYKGGLDFLLYLHIRPRYINYIGLSYTNLRTRAIQIDQ